MKPAHLALAAAVGVSTIIISLLTLVAYALDQNHVRTDALIERITVIECHLDLRVNC